MIPGELTLTASCLLSLFQIAFTFLMCVLFRKTALTNLVVFLLTLFWGLVGLTTFYTQLPSSVQWILSICSPFAFTAGMTQVREVNWCTNELSKEFDTSSPFHNQQPFKLRALVLNDSTLKLNLKMLLLHCTKKWPSPEEMNKKLFQNFTSQVYFLLVLFLYTNIYLSFHFS